MNINELSRLLVTDESGWADVSPDGRVNGYWYFDVNPAIDPKSFYRASDTPAPAAARAPGASIN